LYNCTKQEEKHNRYSDILPCKLSIYLDQNNVIKCQGTQYFNASPIVLLSGQKLIATQAPVPPFENFWRVVID
jgi:protein tyrosine phosphatase